jgi:hypothetical protein
VDFKPEFDEMTSLRKIAASVTCVAVICAAAILWPVYKQKATERKLAEAARVDRVRAEQGDAKAQHSLGVSYTNGEGVPRDYAEAVRWYRKAADQGFAKAQYGLAFSYAYGQGVSQDYAAAVRWSRKAAEQGLATAQYALGMCYADGQGVPRDYAEAVRWSRKAADQGDTNAQYALGYMYRNGQGVPQDYAEAVRWFRKAAEQGDTKAQVVLGKMYRTGQGVPVNYAQSVRWYGKAAASCFVFVRTQDPAARWTAIVVILLGLLVLVAPKRRWGRAKWLPSALTSALCAVMLAHELSLSASVTARLAHGLVGTLYQGVGRILLLAFLAGGSVIFALMAVQAVRQSKRGQPPTQPEGILENPT